MEDHIKAFREEVEAQPGYWAQRAMSSASMDLQRLMVKRGLTRAQLAERIGKSKAYISKVFNEDVNFTLSTLVSLARALDGRVEIRIVPAEVCAVTPAAPQLTITPVVYAKPVPLALSVVGTSFIQPVSGQNVPFACNDLLYDAA